MNYGVEDTRNVDIRTDHQSQCLRHLCKYPRPSKKKYLYASLHHDREIIERNARLLFFMGKKNRLSE